MQPDVEDQHRRKRVRKGTRSCWECRRRKIRCKWAEEASKICEGCTAREIQCVSQEFVDEGPAPSSKEVADRLERVESLLDKVLQKIGDDSQLVLDRSASSVESALEDRPYLPSRLNSLEDRRILSPTPGSDDVEEISSTYPIPILAASSNKKNNTKSEIESTREYLLSLVPPQQFIIQVTTNSSSWHFIQRYIIPQIGLGEGMAFTEFFSIIPRQDFQPVQILRTMLNLALGLQQLPPDFDSDSLPMKGSPAELEQTIIIQAGKFLSDNALVISLDGIECFLLYGTYYLNAGQFRRSWTATRRALGIAHMLGLQRKSYRPETTDKRLEERKKFVWCKVVRANLYSSLILGVCSGLAPSHTLFNDDVGVRLNALDIYTNKLHDLSRQIVDRCDNTGSHVYIATQNIDLQTKELANTIPPSWWRIPSPMDGRPYAEVSADVDKVMATMLHCQILLYLHLPFLSTSESLYSYNRQNCLQSARQIVERWSFLRDTSTSAFYCRSFDFQAFIACLVLLIGISQSQPVSQTAQQLQDAARDHNIVRKVVGLLENRALTTSDDFTRQILQFLAILGCTDPNGRYSRVKDSILKIPCFGNIEITSAVPGARATAPAESEPASEMRGDHIVNPGTSNSDRSLRYVVYFRNTRPPVIEEMDRAVRSLTYPNKAEILVFDSLMSDDVGEY